LGFGKARPECRFENRELLHFAEGAVSEEARVSGTFLPHPTIIEQVHHNFKFYRAIPLFPKPGRRNRRSGQRHNLRIPAKKSWP
jgi:hypothetical protein